MNKHGGTEAEDHPETERQPKHLASNGEQSPIGLLRSSDHAVAITVLAVKARVAGEAGARERGELGSGGDQAAQPVVGDVEARQQGQPHERRRYLPGELVVRQFERLEGAQGRQRRRDRPGQRVPAQVEQVECPEVAELRRDRAGQAVPAQVHRRRDVAVVPELAPVDVPVVQPHAVLGHGHLRAQGAAGERSQTRQGVRDLAGERVVREVYPVERVEAAEPRRYLAGQPVPRQVQHAQPGAGAQPRRHRAAERAVGDAEQPQAWEPADGAGTRHLLALEVGGEDEDGEGTALLERPERRRYTGDAVDADVEEGLRLQEPEI
jgi:hypothetical protein